jgi:hypothetical protein
MFPFKRRGCHGHDHMVVGFTTIKACDFIYRWKDPEVFAHIEKHSVSWCLIGTKWFICLFADVLPVEVSNTVI